MWLMEVWEEDYTHKDDLFSSLKMCTCAQFANVRKEACETRWCSKEQGGIFELHKGIYDPNSSLWWGNRPLATLVLSVCIFILVLFLSFVLLQICELIKHVSVVINDEWYIVPWCNLSWMWHYVWFIHLFILSIYGNVHENVWK